MEGFMAKTHLFEKIFELKEKFKHLFIQKKKLKALENYSEVVDFQHKDYITLIKRCMADGFLGDKEADFLCYLLEKYEVNFLDWSHRTKWLKTEISRLSEQKQRKKEVQLTLFNLPSMPSNHVPFELIKTNNKLIGRI